MTIVLPTPATTPYSPFSQDALWYWRCSTFYCPLVVPPFVVDSISCYLLPYPPCCICFVDRHSGTLFVNMTAKITTVVSASLRNYYLRGEPLVERDSQPSRPPALPHRWAENVQVYIISFVGPECETGRDAHPRDRHVSPTFTQTRPRVC